MRGSVPVLLLFAVVGCASPERDLRKPDRRTLVAHQVCPQPGSAEQARTALASPSGFADLISADETRAFGPVRIIWVHPPDEVVNRCR